MGRMLKLGALAAAVLMLGACSAAADSSTPKASTVVGRAKQAKKLTVGIMLDQPGLSLKLSDSKLVGFDIDVAKYVAKELGVEEDGIVWKETRAAERETLIMDGSVDFVVASYSITDGRKQQISFAGPYFLAGQSLLVRLNAKGITGPESLNGKRLCAVKNSTSAQQVRDRYAQSASLVEYFRYSECVTALLIDRVDAVTSDDLVLAGFAAQNPELLKLTGRSFSEEYYGIGLKKEDRESRAAISGAVEKMINTGAWKESLDRNIGPSGYQIPKPPKVTEK